MLNLLAKDCAQLREGKKRRDEANDVKINIEDLLHRIQLHSVKANVQRAKITQVEFIQLCRKARATLLNQPALLRINGPIHISTGTLGNYKQLSNIFDRCGHPKFINYIFLGDYSGRYDQSLQCLIAIFAYKLFTPYNFFILRGCHETILRAKSSGLQQHLSQYFGSSLPWLEVLETFCSLPYAAIVDEKIFCVHGGISPYLQSLEQINQIPRPLDAPDKELACDLLNADPSPLYKGWTENDRGMGVAFGPDVVLSFLKTHDLTVICRGHEVPYQGFRYFADKKMVTICSLAEYATQVNNASAVMMVDESGNFLPKLVSQKANYTGQEREEGLTFIDIVQRKKERARKLEEQKEKMKIDEQMKKIQQIEKRDKRKRLKL